MNTGRTDAAGIHFLRDAQAEVSKGHDEMAAATIRTIFAQPGQVEVRAQVEFTGLCLDAVAVHVLEVLTFATYVSEELGSAFSWDVGITVTNLPKTRPVPSPGAGRSSAVGLYGHGYEAARTTRTTRADVAPPGLTS